MFITINVGLLYDLSKLYFILHFKIVPDDIVDRTHKQAHHSMRITILNVLITIKPSLGICVHFNCLSVVKFIGPSAPSTQLSNRTYK